MSEEIKFRKLRLSAKGTNSGSGFDILYDFGENYDFVEGVSKKEFLFIQPWMQFPNRKYSDECIRVSVELVRRFNDFEGLERQVKDLFEHNEVLRKKLESAGIR